MKQCSKCKNVKSLDCFYKLSNDKLRSHCKMCNDSYPRSNNYHKNYQKTNRLKLNKYTNTYILSRKKTDINFKLLISIRNRLSKAISNQYGNKSQKTVNLLGCSIQDVRKHLENLFQPGMSWSNYGQWEIDHIKPCSSFDLTDNQQQKSCFNYTNLQPLWKTDNLKKSDKE